MLGASEWAWALRLYEWMQPEKDTAEDEWRIVQGQPFTFNPSIDDRQGLVEEALGVAKTWGLTGLKVETHDILCVLCPEGQGEAVRRRLPDEFQSVRVRIHGPLQHVAELLRWRFRRLRDLVFGRRSALSPADSAKSGERVNFIAYAPQGDELAEIGRQDGARLFSDCDRWKLRFDRMKTPEPEIHLETLQHYIDRGTTFTVVIEKEGESHRRAEAVLTEAYGSEMGTIAGQFRGVDPLVA